MAEAIPPTSIKEMKAFMRKFRDTFGLFHVMNWKIYELVREPNPKMEILEEMLLEESSDDTAGD